MSPVLKSLQIDSDSDKISETSSIVSLKLRRLDTDKIRTSNMKNW